MKDLLGPGGGTEKKRGGGAGGTPWAEGITSLRRASGYKTPQRKRIATCDAAGARSLAGELPSVRRGRCGGLTKDGCAAAGTRGGGLGAGRAGGLGGGVGAGRVRPCRGIHPPKCSPPLVGGGCACPPDVLSSPWGRKAAGTDKGKIHGFLDEAFENGNGQRLVGEGFAFTSEDHLRFIAVAVENFEDALPFGQAGESPCSRISLCRGDRGRERRPSEDWRKPHFADARWHGKGRIPAVPHRFVALVNPASPESTSSRRRALRERCLHSSDASPSSIIARFSNSPNPSSPRLARRLTMQRRLIGLLILTPLFLGLALVSPQPVLGSAVSDVIQEIENERTPGKRAKLFKKLHAIQPETSADVEHLIKTARRAEGRPASLAALRRIKAPLPPEMREKILSLVDVDDDIENLPILSSALDLNTRIQIPGAQERILARLKREPKTTIQRREDLHYLWKDGGEKRKQIERIRLLAASLARLKDEESLAYLCSLDEVVAAGSPGEILAPYRTLALDFAIAQYPRETGLRRDGLLDVISHATYADALPRLRKLLAAPDAQARQVAIDTLVRANAPDIDDVLDRMKWDVDGRVRALSATAALRRNPPKNRAALMNSISGKGPADELTALRILAASPIPGTEEELEKFIREDEKKRPHSPGHRYFAAKAIWKLTGRKIEYSRGLATNQYYPWDDPVRQ